MRTLTLHSHTLPLNPHFRRSLVAVNGLIGIPYQGEGGRAVGCTTTAAAIDLRRQTDVCILSAPTTGLVHMTDVFLLRRADDKVVKEFNISAGAVLHLVLALRGGAW